MTLRSFFYFVSVQFQSVVIITLTQRTVVYYDYEVAGSSDTATHIKFHLRWTHHIIGADENFRPQKVVKPQLEASDDKGSTLGGEPLVRQDSRKLKLT